MLAVDSSRLALLLALAAHAVHGKGLQEGVPCSRKVECDLGSGQLIDLKYARSEEKCQQLCYLTDGCTSYTWWDDVAISDENDQVPFLCELFSTCMHMTQCFGCHSGPVSCDDHPITIIGGGGADTYLFSVETLFTQKNVSGHLESFTVEDVFDPLPSRGMVGAAGLLIEEWPHYQHYYENRYLVCGGVEEPKTCRYLNFTNGQWSDAPSPRYERAFGAILTLDNSTHSHNYGDVPILIGGNTTGVEYLKASRWWNTISEWELPEIKHESCFVAVNDTIFNIGGRAEDYSAAFASNMRLDHVKGWVPAADMPTARSSMGCLATVIDNVAGILVTGGWEGWYKHSRAVEFYSIFEDTWTELPPLKEARFDHQLVHLDEKPAVIGGSHFSFDENCEPEADIHVKNSIHVMNMDTKEWAPIDTTMKWRRSSFLAIHNNTVI